MWVNAKVPNDSSASNAWAKPSHESTPSGSRAMAPVPDLGHGRLPLDCPSRITTGADQRLCLAQKRWVVEHVRLADGVAPIG